MNQYHNKFTFTRHHTLKYFFQGNFSRSHAGIEQGPLLAVKYPLLVVGSKKTQVSLTDTLKTLPIHEINEKGLGHLIVCVRCYS